MDYERERRRQKRYREAMRNRIIAAVLLAGIIVGAIFIIKGCKKDDAPADAGSVSVLSVRLKNS